MEFIKFLVDMFRFPFVIIFLIFTLFSTNLLALEVDDLYQANVVVDSQAKEQREQAIKQALQGVFLKVGGKKSVLTHQVLQQAQKRASRYVSQYRYQRKGAELSLVVSFNEDKVNQLFKDAKLARWGSLRPQVLLWLIDEQGASRTMVASDADSIIPASVHDFSIQRGLPIIMPLMDLTDSEHVVVSDFWGYFPEQIQQASLRYFADTIVVMRVSDSSLVNKEDIAKAASAVDNIACGLLCQPAEVDRPKVLDWRVYTQGTLYTQTYQGVNKVSLINQGLSDITELIYQSYALLTSAENNFVIEVNNVTSLKHDTQLFTFLADLSAVKNVTLIRAQGNVRRFKLDLLGSKASFLASLKLNNKLTQQIDTQLDSFSQRQPFNPQKTAQAELNETNNPVRFTVLGEIEVAGLTPYQGNLKANKIVLIDENLAVTNSAQDKGNNLAVKSAIERATNTSLTTVFVAKPQLTRVPSIPVFYWEQG
ncbi:DUF2066 domain-containing protein [Colwellia sp. TT2012]|uniref:DUF2066 domain-containing protein n=1 Tax=Colwellia sp. TT2012 TaxID=1720342 RepID=UPI000A4FD0FC|nr:DUF2066 domain-containing protein [Colwellia sp. TT2012]